MDDGHSSYGPEQSDKFNKLKEHFDSNVLNFETKCLELPKGNADSEDHLTPAADSIQSMLTADTQMGQDLDDLFKILNHEAREELSNTRCIIEHRWNAATSNFEK